MDRDLEGNTYITLKENSGLLYFVVLIILSIRNDDTGVNKIIMLEQRSQQLTW